MSGAGLQNRNRPVLPSARSARFILRPRARRQARSAGTAPPAAPVGALLFIFFLAGCAASGGRQVLLLDGRTVAGDEVCLADASQIPSFFNHFYATRDLTTEEGKIDYLIERVGRSSLVFIRSNVEFGGYASAQFLRWKLDRLRWRYHFKIETADDFIEQVASQSRTTGSLYAVRLPNGEQHRLGHVLKNELRVLYRCLDELAAKEQAARALEKSVAEESAGREENLAAQPAAIVGAESA